MQLKKKCSKIILQNKNKYKNKNKKMENKDILKELEKTFLLDKEENINTPKKENKIIFNYEVVVKKEKNTKKRKNKFLNFSMFILKYTTTCAFIFWVLLLSTNYSAYFNIAKSYILKEEMQEKSKSIISSVEAANLKSKVIEKIEKKDDFSDKEIENNIWISSIRKYKKNLNSKDIQLDIEITPYENRILIPKIGKNIPLLDVKNREVESEHELENIFMKELENGVVRYPWSAIPWENGTTFIFWHSSNFPWMKWNYNDVFATLDNVVYGDEVIVYYWQKKYKYIIREKRVITPWDVSILKRNKNKNEISIMTCWPIWTTLNRLIVVWELVLD